jgi:GNAT superfamily N-acetyltransferase
MSALFRVGAAPVRPIERHQVPLLQALYDANPGYFVLLNGRPAPPDAAAQDYAERPPAHLPYDAIHFLGLFNPKGALDGAAILAQNQCTAGAWHIALFFVATHLHGGGTAQAFYDALEAWMRSQGARWLRLNVADVNLRAQAFWARQGFVVLRERDNMDTGGALHTMQVRLKPPLGEDAAASIAEYLQRVPRDEPGSPLP